MSSAQTFLAVVGLETDWSVFRKEWNVRKWKVTRKCFEKHFFFFLLTYMHNQPLEGRRV